MLTLLILEEKNHKKWEHKCVFATLAGKIINFMEKGLQQLMWWGQRGHKHSLWNICMQNIHDYLTYGLLVGCQMKGYMACPLRDPMVDTRCSSHFKKNVYQGHWHYLSTHHPYQRFVSLSMDMWNIDLHQQEYLQLIFQEWKMNMWRMVD
jgi:hypothetical protein